MSLVGGVRRVSGLSGSVAKNVVQWREANGAFKSRQQLLQVGGLGPKTFEQSAGFLRIRGGENPLDMTGVHPETYPVVEKIVGKIPIFIAVNKCDLIDQAQFSLKEVSQMAKAFDSDFLHTSAKTGEGVEQCFKKLGDLVVEHQLGV